MSGTHAYATTGQNAVTVSLSDDAPGTATATANSTANVMALAGQIRLTAATEGVALPRTTTVATFTDLNTSDTASIFTASINWGDGTSTTGVVSGSNGTFTVKGGHTYADEGSFPLGVTITDTANSTSLPLSGTVTAAEADVLSAKGLTFRANAGQAFSGKVATFTDRDTSNVASDFSATINWGDGSTTVGVITDTRGAISVSGTHTYASSSQDAVTVTLTDDAPGSATATAHSTAKVGSTALGSPASQGSVSSASDLLWKNPANGDNGLFAASRNSVLQAWHDYAGSAVIPPFHNTTEDGSHDTSTSLANFATLDAGGLDRGHGTDALLFRDDRVGELGSHAASNGLNTGSHTTDGSSVDYRTVR